MRDWGEDHGRRKQARTTTGRTAPTRTGQRRTKEDRVLTLIEQIRRDAFFGGVCCALTAALYMDDGTHPGYVEAVRSVGAEELLAYARREKDIELPRIRQAIRAIRRREARKT